ncbi:MAG: hypothetical protein IC227_01925 [Enterococcus lacertideformus]|uniref:Uncharacterized protein n=1 Tax=Enterococcus lacertideformus TaxID=2771493 RepID=A0A931AT73_9ENTE|nr:hypothetical protein [Enterococcus lacertideformus]
MGKKKNLSKAKKLRKQLLTASATGLILLSSVAGPTTSLAYAQEATGKEKTEATNATQGSVPAAVSAKANESSLQYNLTNFPIYNGPFKSGYTVKWPTLRGAHYKVVLKYGTRGSSPINFAVNGKDVQVENSYVGDANSQVLRHYTTILTFTANANTTDCKVTWEGYGPEVAGSTIAIGASSDAPQDLVQYAGEIDTFMANLFKSDGSLQAHVTQEMINLSKETLQQIIPQDSGYWINYIGENLQAASDLLNNTPYKIKTDIDSLRTRAGSGIASEGLNSNATQSAFDALQKRIDALPSINPVLNQKKQEVQSYFNQISAMLQEIQLKSSTGQVVAQIDSSRTGTYVRTFTETIPGNNVIGKIQITRPKYNTYENLFNQEYRGGTYQDTVSNTKYTQGGDSLIITTNEAPLAVNSNVKLSNTVSKTYTFIMNDQAKWILQSSSYDSAKSLVDALFNGDVLKPTNTQAQIDQAKSQVNNLLDGTEKEALLARINEAQQALNGEEAKVKEATDAENTLFNGDTPKAENTQEQINAVKAKVDALKAGEAKTALLAKVQKAQDALEAKHQQKITLNPYTLGDEYVTGTITGAIKKFQIIVNGQTYEPGFKLVNGKFEVYVGNRVPEGTKNFTLKDFNVAGTQVASQTVEVQAPALSVDKYILGSEYMTGSYTGNSIKKLRLTVDGKVYEPGFKLVNGKFEVYIGNKINSNSKVIKLEGLDKAGKTIAEQNVTLEKPQLHMDDYTRGNEYLTGTIEGEGVKKFKLIIDGKESMPGFKLTADNKFEIYVGNKVPGNVNTIKVVGVDKAGQEIVSQDVTVQNPTLTADEYIAGNEYVTGSFTGEAVKKFKLVVNGKESFPGFQISEGNKFKVYIGNKAPVGTPNFTLIGLDKNGQQVTSEQITVQSPSLAIDEFVRGDEYMSGTFKGEGIKKFKLVVDGKESTPGFKITEGNHFEVYVGNKVTASSKSVKLEGLDQANKVLVSQDVTVAQPELVANEYKRNAEYLTGTFKGDIRSFKLIVAGKEYKLGFKLKAGNQFEVYIGNKVPSSVNSFTIESLSFDGKQLVSVEVPVI